MFKKILIANRGEIAVRILAACRKLGVAAVTVHSEADARAAHVLQAEESVLLGPAPVVQSYLRIDRLLEIAQQTGCDAVHPGYGLLSENADFARRCAEAGLTFIGPSPEVIAAMGSKTAAREAMAAHGLPVVPGSNGAAADLAEAERIAAELGYPVMLKAAAGGGGIGMQALHDPAELEKAWKMATARAKAYFGDDTMYVEKLIVQPRHIEVQVLADHHGHVVHLFERDCSVQRRHQKVVEEAPAPLLPADVRARMGAAAVAAAKAIGYTNAGTFEFLVDAQHQFYFLEMNTRIQVEHPVTELVTGTDLVACQIRVAAGETLPFTQDDLRCTGHAIEARLYAEDPKTFMPAPGQITELEWPTDEAVRIDTWIAGDTLVTPHYDPMLAKIVVHGDTREEAIARLRQALEATRLSGIKTNLPALLDILAHEEFRAGRHSTDFVPSRLQAAAAK
ncbi:MAG: acetyl-CoA carboxylase biotin carboxylase subunit [Candidatus Sericytochromatia bacterium]|nr:acetyl-CoA carboxylase biotin carboxylase subunit [Candidatus Sericytochromatia bacterium]